MITFNSKTLDQKALSDRAMAEAKLIYSKPSTRRGRSLEKIFETCAYGHAAEQFLIEKKGYTDDDRPYKDVIDPNGEPVEVKVTEGDYYIKYVLKRCNDSASEAWRNYPKKLIVFTCNNKLGSTNYKLYGEYSWDGNEFKKV